jgi:hypothetical protein
MKSALLLILSGAFALLGTGDALAQFAIGEQRLSQEVTGGTMGKVAETNIVSNIGQSILPPRHVDSAGTICLTVSPYPRNQTINANIFDQMLILDNRCGAEIRIRACYLNTSSCKVMSVGGYKRVEQTLGIFSSPYFQFSYREYVH